MALSRGRRLAPADRRIELLESAERVVRARGRSACVDDVVRAARVARGTFYVYFETWDALLHALRERVFDDFDERFPLPDLTSPDVDWRFLIEELVEDFVGFTLELKGLHAALFHDAAAREPVTEPRFDILGRIAGLLRAGNAAGALDVPDPEAMAPLVFALLHETVDVIEAGADRERSLEACRLTLWRALAARVRWRQS